MEFVPTTTPFLEDAIKNLVDSGRVMAEIVPETAEVALGRQKWSKLETTDTDSGADFGADLFPGSEPHLARCQPTGPAKFNPFPAALRPRRP